jgi:hypothetical protein
LRSSVKTICRPLLRKASSRRRLERVSKLKTSSVKICPSGLKVMVVPLPFALPSSSSSVVFKPRS